IAMDLAGSDFSKVESEKADFSALLGLLLQGKIDGHTTFLTTSKILSAVVSNAGKTPQFVHFGESLDMYGSVLIANEQFLAERPDVARRAMEATQCALKAAPTDPEAAVDALLELFPEKKRESELAAIGGGIELIFDSSAHAENGFNWDETRVRTTHSNTMKAQGQAAEFGSMSDYIHNF
ncbi:MAG: ABC transporter substrate-binding protein, partial [Roseibium sp.]